MPASNWVSRRSPAVRRAIQPSDLDSFNSPSGDVNATSGVPSSSFTNRWRAEGKDSRNHDSLLKSMNAHPILSSPPPSPPSAHPLDSSPLPFSTLQGRPTSESNLPSSNSNMNNFNPQYPSAFLSSNSTSTISGSIKMSLHREASKDKNTTSESTKRDVLYVDEKIHERDEKEKSKTRDTADGASLMLSPSATMNCFSPSLQKGTVTFAVASVPTAATGGTSMNAWTNLSLIPTSSKQVSNPKRSVSFYSLGRLSNPFYQSSSLRSTKSILSSPGVNHRAVVPHHATQDTAEILMAKEDPLSRVGVPPVSMEENEVPCRSSCSRDDESNASTTSSRSIIVKHAFPPPALHAPPAILDAVETGEKDAVPSPSTTAALHLSASVKHDPTYRSTSLHASGGATETKHVQHWTPSGVSEDRDSHSPPSSVLPSSIDQVFSPFHPVSPIPHSCEEETRPTTAGFLAARQAAPYDRVHQGNRRGLLELLKLRGDVAALRSKRPISSQHPQYPPSHPLHGKDAPVYRQMKPREPFHFVSSTAEGKKPLMVSLPVGKHEKEEGQWCRKKKEEEESKENPIEEKGPLDDGASRKGGVPLHSFPSSSSSSFSSSSSSSSRAKSLDKANGGRMSTIPFTVVPSTTEQQCRRESAPTTCSRESSRSHGRCESGESTNRKSTKGESTGLRCANVDPHRLPSHPVASSTGEVSPFSLLYASRTNSPSSDNGRQRFGENGGESRGEVPLPSSSVRAGSDALWQRRKKTPSTKTSPIGPSLTPVPAGMPMASSSSPSSLSLPSRSFSATCLSPAPWQSTTTSTPPLRGAAVNARTSSSSALSTDDEKSTTVRPIGKPLVVSSLPMNFSPSSVNNVLPSPTQEAIQQEVDRRSAVVAAATAAVEGGSGASAERYAEEPAMGDAEEGPPYPTAEEECVDDAHRAAHFYELTEGEIEDAWARQSCDAVGLTPVLASYMPKGRYVLINMLTTWGDNHEVGLCEVEFYNERGESVLWRREREVDRSTGGERRKNDGQLLAGKEEGGRGGVSGASMVPERDATAPPAGVSSTTARGICTPSVPRAIDMGTEEVSVDKVMNMVSITAASVDDSVRLLVEYSATPEDLFLWEKKEAAREPCASSHRSGSGHTSRGGSGKQGRQNSRSSRSATGVSGGGLPTRLTAAEQRIQEDPRRQIAAMINGVVNTHDESHMLALPYTPGHHHLLCFMFARPICLSMIRIYNYCGRGRAQTFKGVRIAEIMMDDDVIFRGEIQRHSGALCSGEEIGSPELRNCENILFTEDKATLMRIIAGGGCRGNVSTGNASFAAVSRASGKEGQTTTPEEEAGRRKEEKTPPHAVEEEGRKEDGGQDPLVERGVPVWDPCATGAEVGSHAHDVFLLDSQGASEALPPTTSCVIVRSCPVAMVPEEMGTEAPMIWRGGELHPCRLAGVPAASTPTVRPIRKANGVEGGVGTLWDSADPPPVGPSVPPSSLSNVPLPHDDPPRRLLSTSGTTSTAEREDGVVVSVDHPAARKPGSALHEGQPEHDSLASIPPSVSSPDRLRSRAHRTKQAQYPSLCPDNIRSVCFLFLATWGDPKRIGLSGLRFRTASGQLIEEAVCAWRVQYPDGSHSSLEDAAAFTEQIGFLFDENPNTACMLPFMSGMQLVIIFDRPVSALGFLEVANYSVGDTTYCGVKEVRLFLSKGEPLPQSPHASGASQGKEANDRRYNFGIAEREIERFRALWTLARDPKSRALLLAGKVSEVTPAYGVSLRKAPARLSVPRFQTYDLSLQVGAAEGSNTVDAWGEATTCASTSQLSCDSEKSKGEGEGEHLEIENVHCSIAVGPGTGGESMDIALLNGGGGGGGIGYCASSFANSLNASMNIRAAMAMRRARMALRERPEWLLQYQPYLTPLLPVGYVCKVKLHICAKDVEGRQKLREGGLREESLAGDRHHPRKRLVAETLKAFMREWVVDPFGACAFANENGENIRPVPLEAVKATGRRDGEQPKGPLPPSAASSPHTVDKGTRVGKEASPGVSSTFSSGESPHGAACQSNLHRWQRQKPTTEDVMRNHDDVGQVSSFSSPMKSFSCSENRLETERNALKQCGEEEEAALHSEEEEEEEEEGVCYLPIVAESVIKPLPPPVTPYQDRHTLEVSMELMYVADIPFCLAVLCLNAPLVYNGSAAWVKRVQVYMDDSMIFDSGDAGISLSKTSTRPPRLSVTSPHLPPSSVFSLFSHRQGKDKEKLENRRNSSLCSPLVGSQKVNESLQPSSFLHSPRSLRQDNMENNLSNPIQRLALLPPCVSSIQPYILFTLDHNVLEEVKKTVSEMSSNTQ